MKAHAIAVVASLGVLAAGARGQGAAAPGTVAQDAAAGAPASAPPAHEPAWAFGFTAYHYSVPEDDDYLQPTLTADRGALHLEARHNYEGRDASSAWVGYNLAGGDEVPYELTPMVGAVFGDTRGAALGYRGSVGWRSLELYSEGEYLFDFDEHDDSYLYNWSELTVSATEWLRAGVVVQRTRAYETDVDVQRGLLLGLSLERIDLAAHVFEPGDDDAVYVLSFGVGF
jgi:hypothetical protein